VIEHGRAAGVRYRLGNKSLQVRANREVILAAGAIGSPQLLLLSGVGPADELRALDLPVVADLPGVGKNLQDHVMVPVSVADRSRLSGNVQPHNLLGWLAQHALTGRGPMASNAAEAGAFARTRLARSGEPDLQLIFLPVGSDQVSYDDQNFLPTGHAFSLVSTLLYPQSRGEITLRSKDPAAHPRIDPRYFREDADMRVLLEGVRMAQAVIGSRALAHCRGRSLSPLADLEDEADLRAEVRQRCNTLFHPVGTCKMGSDPQAVVDASLRVHGVAGLRVADASIMPEIVGGNTNAPVIMIAEKAAELILTAAETDRVTRSPRVGPVIDSRLDDR
jgi:choline dehydrogenase